MFGYYPPDFREVQYVDFTTPIQDHETKLLKDVIEKKFNLEQSTRMAIDGWLHYFVNSLRDWWNYRPEDYE